MAITLIDLEFQGQIFNLLYFRVKKFGLLRTETNISIMQQASNVDVSFDLIHDLGLFWVMLASWEKTAPVSI